MPVAGDSRQKANLPMAVEYCHRGDHYIDLDKNVEGKYLDNNGILEWCCWDCLTDEEVEQDERKEEFETFVRKMEKQQESETDNAG